MEELKNLGAHYFDFSFTGECICGNIITISSDTALGYDGSNICFNCKRRYDMKFVCVDKKGEK